MNTAMYTYDQLPSNAIDRVVIDSAEGTVEVVYKSSQRSYTYSTEDTETFNRQFLAEFESEDVSIGRFISDNVGNGTLQILND